MCMKRALQIFYSSNQCVQFEQLSSWTCLRLFAAHYSWRCWQMKRTPYAVAKTSALFTIAIIYRLRRWLVLSINQKEEIWLVWTPFATTDSQNKVPNIVAMVHAIYSVALALGAAVPTHPVPYRRPWSCSMKIITTKAIKTKQKLNQIKINRKDNCFFSFCRLFGTAHSTATANQMPNYVIPRTSLTKNTISSH